MSGPQFMITVDGIESPFQITRGEMKTVTFTAENTGTIDFWASNHDPNMRGEIVILPRPA